MAGVLGALIGSLGKGKPGVPTNVVATDVGTLRPFNNGAASVAFTAGSGPAATSYTVTSSPGGFTASGASSPLTVTGLASSTQYTYTVTATNAVGTSDASAASAGVTATTVPQAPTIGSATAGNALATVTYTPGATGGKAVSTYTATSTPGGQTGTGGTPITVSGLTNGTAYTFTVTATNANGTSTASSASNSVTPVNPIPVVTGGTLYSDATYYYRAFTTSGTLGISNQSLSCDILAIGGGGSGGYQSNSSAGGGGGSGSAVYATSQTLGVGSKTVTIGTGGVSQTVSGSQGNDGGDTSISGTSILAYGGGGGGAVNNGAYGGRSKGTGGGGAANLTTVGAGGTVANVSTGGTAYQFAGNNATSSTKNSSSGGGGGIGSAPLGRGSGSHGLDTWSSWFQAGASTVPNFQVVLASGSSALGYSITVPSTTNLSTGMLISGSGIPAGLFVNGISSNTQINVSAQVQAQSYGQLTFTANFIGAGGGGAVSGMFGEQSGRGFGSNGVMSGANGVQKYGAEAKFGGGGGGAVGGGGGSRAGGDGLVIVRYLRSAVGG